MGLSICNHHPLIRFSFEDTKRKQGIRIWGDRKSFHELHELLSDCWNCADGCMSPAEQCSYIGVIAYFSYTVRHTFMGDRLVKMDGKMLKQWDDELVLLFESEQDRFQVGKEFSWPQMLFIMAAWWECLRHQDCAVDILPVIRDFTENIELLLQQRSKLQYPAIEPYIHGAIYAANPYLMHTMEHINVDYLERSRLGRVPLSKLAEMMQCAAFGTMRYVIASNSRDCATAGQWMLKQWTLRLICLSLQSTLPDSLERSMTWICPSVMSKCSYTMLQWLNEYFQRSEKART